MHIVCVRCGTTNRVPDERLGEQPICGHCGSAVLPKEPVAMSDGNLPNYLANTDMPVLVDFWSEWCGPCKVFAPQFAQAASQRADIRFVKVDSDLSPHLSTRHHIRSIPTVVLFKGGRELARVSGAMSAPQLLSWADQAMQAAHARM